MGDKGSVNPLDGKFVVLDRYKVRAIGETPREVFDQIVDRIGADTTLKAFGEGTIKIYEQHSMMVKVVQNEKV